jgi:hypothetical protein
MASDKSTIRTQILSLCGNNVAITASDVNIMLVADDAEILESFTWSRRKAWTVINTVAPTSITIGVTNGSATVTGAGFTAAMVGRMIRIGGEDAYYRIASVVAGVSAVLGDSEGTSITYPGATDTSISARIWQHVYPVSSIAEIVTGIPGLEEIDKFLLDQLDPTNISEADPSLYWCHYGRNSSGVLQVALMPLPSAARSYRVEFKKVADFADDADVPLYRPDVLKWKSAESAAAFLLAKTGDQAWAALADRYHSRYNEALTAAKEDDILKQSLPTLIGPEPGIGLLSDEFLLDHDVFRPY